MNNFSEYAKYYDLLYRDKDYLKETSYVENLLNRYLNDFRNILELGCGTGEHAIILAKSGYTVYGIDLSNNMINKANRKKNQLSTDISEKLFFEKGDVRSYNTDKKFNAIISLFHVMSYQTKNRDLIDTFRVVSKYLAKGGIFLFDCWYGPGVLNEKPEIRKINIESADTQVSRKSSPTIYPNQNIVDVNFDIAITNKRTQKVSRFTELHKMRYLFKPELANYLQQASIELIHSEEWLTGKELGFHSWYATFIGKKI